ncbi:Os10g0570200 [Oryza sativa Japonica Group]|uniref:Os10g0570200 protein n=2 Tax=Oryza sativa subsp. japonica TaxID=39947 RepID=B9G745_ORYSJ|nr:expressed protein [Oryza sativa Japonica Group]EEE51442.1 hypothetical protein OsJ_32534 [Oryza sativa Japonica Group]BAF27289.1 Os10g0570200 [Oryza sativa Japonica Group]BAG88585.1 unnamed protein product [Oryza sativa Japonica Group]BAT12152.1 Os10g0570200 [Oryza sativa Japonica Group]|eukprot:NP_001065452.1 Os10g0570200 [Oryza sativa Japonica Group]
MMRKQSSSSTSRATAAVVSLCKVLLMVIGLICALHTATVEGGRALAAAAVGGTGVDLPPTAPSYSSKCRYPYKCPPAGSP